MSQTHQVLVRARQFQPHKYEILVKPPCTSHTNNSIIPKSWGLREKLLLIANLIQFVIILSQFQSQDILLYVSSNQPTKIQQSQIYQMQSNSDTMGNNKVAEPVVCPEAQECVCPSEKENEDGGEEAELDFMIEETGQHEKIEDKHSEDEKIEAGNTENTEKTKIPNRETKILRKAALIVTEIRSGSSFFGEIFNYHPNVFYLYEPLVLSQRQYQTLSNNLCNTVLKNLPELDERRNYDQDLLIDYFGECNLPDPQFYA